HGDRGQPGGARRHRRRGLRGPCGPATGRGAGDRLRGVVPTPPPTQDDSCGGAGHPEPGSVAVRPGDPMTSPTPELLVQPTQLAAELAEDDGSPLVLDVRYNLMGPDGHQEYREAHVPGAVWVDLDAELAGAPGSGGRHPLPEPDVFVAAMRRVGLTNATPVVVCDGGSLLGASRLWWLRSEEH